MRTQGSLRLILNTKVWPGMTVERASQKSVRVTGTDGDSVKVFLLMVRKFSSTLDCTIPSLNNHDPPGVLGFLTV